jgi:hypothetical protein
LIILFILELNFNTYDDFSMPRTCGMNRNVARGWLLTINNHGRPLRPPSCHPSHTWPILAALSELTKANSYAKLTLRFSNWVITNNFVGLQFPDVVEFCEAMANAGKIVVVAALDGTYQRSGKN